MVNNFSGVAYNRNASEFYKAEEHNNPEISLQYGTLFPKDVTFTIGKSNYAKDSFSNM